MMVLKKWGADGPLLLAGVGITLGWLACWLLSGVWRGSPYLIPATFLPFIPYGIAIVFILHSPKAGDISARTKWIILGFTALFHVMLLFTRHPLSNDLYRYLWDGRVLAAGINPYSYPPAAGELAFLRNPLWELILNRNVSTGYPPLIEMLFALIASTGAGLFGLRLLAVSASLGTSVTLMRILRELGQDERKTLIYAWSPLVALEFGNSGHLDALAICFLALAFWLQLRRKWAGAALFLAAGGLVKFFPALLALFWGRRWGTKAWALFFGMTLLFWLPFLLGGSPFTGLSIFAMQGDFNASLHALIYRLLRVFVEPGTATIASRLIPTGLIAALMVTLTVSWWQREEPALDWRYAMIAMGAILLVSPVVHPWYLCWMVAFIAIEWRPAWLVLSGTIVFARAIYIGYEQTGILSEPPWSRWVVYIPFYLSASAALLRRGWAGLRSAARDISPVREV